MDTGINGDCKWSYGTEPKTGWTGNGMERTWNQPGLEGCENCSQIYKYSTLISFFAPLHNLFIISRYIIAQFNSSRCG
jgi:hypothetical protein